MMKKTIHKVCATIVVIPIVYYVFLFGLISMNEGYNFLKPYVDTEFAEDYSPELFDEITSDLNIEEVKSLIGEPLFIFQDTINGALRIKYDYTNDGYFRKNPVYNNYFMIGDFAWYRSGIIFNEQGGIISIDKGWSYD